MSERLSETNCNGAVFMGGSHVLLSVSEWNSVILPKIYQVQNHTSLTIMFLITI